MKRYGYHRTSTREQHLDRGIIEINEYCKANNLELEKIFTDQQTGKNFNRPRYTIMKEDVLRMGDGSGTLGVCCEKLNAQGHNIQWIGIELERCWCDVAESRIAEIHTNS